MKRFFALCIAIILICAPICPAEEGERIELAILLDTSNSMDGLIDQAKANLWKIVNETARARRGGKAPALRVALYEYGNNGLPAAEGYIRQVVPLTGDLDRISEELFRLKTNGGDEYCGMVIERAVKNLGWSRRDDVYKVMYIAGNEPFGQGSVDYRASARNAVAHGITVNTIYCGTYNEGVAEGWRDGAERGEGVYVSINQDYRAVDIRAPQDAEISRLNGELNKTYLAYGRGGAQSKTRQEKQDTNSAGIANEAAVQRYMAKAAPSYSNSSWDLVDAQTSDAGTVDALKDEELPSEMKKMNRSERKAYVDSMSRKRAGIREKIRSLSEERRRYVEREHKKHAAVNTLDTAIVNTIRTQAGKKGYVFE